MAKKKVQPTSDEIEVIEPEVQETSVETTEEPKVSKKETKKKASQEKEDVKNAKVNSKDKSKTKPKKEKKSLKKKAAEVWSELKKVSKPSFGKVVKNTCVVIAVVAICTLLLFGMDKLFSLVYDLLLP